MAVVRVSGRGIIGNTRFFASGGKVVASGGSITESGGYRIHTFTSGTTNFVVTLPGTVEYLVVAGAGGAGNGSTGEVFGGCGGAGGYKSGSIYVGSTTAATVGPGGGTFSFGSSSSFGTISTTGGGRGAQGNSFAAGGTGGSGGGGSGTNYNPVAPGVGGQGTPGEGNNGGSGAQSFLADAYWNISNTGPGGGGGGAGSVGYTGGGGGSGLSNSIRGTEVFYAIGGAHNVTGAPNTGSGSGNGAAAAAGIVVLRYPLTF